VSPELGENLLGIDWPQPRLSWVLQWEQRGEVQTAFQVLAASSLEKLAKNQGDLWDSGQAKSSQTVDVLYAGQPLHSAQQVFWKVRAWDKAGQPTGWSAPAAWTMGLLKETDWQAQWIGASGTEPKTLLLRREFAVKPGLPSFVLKWSGDMRTLSSGGRWYMYVVTGETMSAGPNMNWSSME